MKEEEEAAEEYIEEVDEKEQGEKVKGEEREVE